jgi:uncharacterized protein (DUF433 family)
MDTDLVALTRDRASSLSGLSLRQIDYWADTGLVSPALDRRVTSHRPIRLYGFVELMSLLLIEKMLGRGISLQHVRRVVAYLKDLGYPQPLTEIRFATHGDSLYFQHPDGSWEGERLPAQVVIHEAIKLKPLRARIAAATRRDPRSIGHVERRRGALGYKPLVAGTRVPVETIERYLRNGANALDIIKAYPLLEPEDVEAVRRLTA